MCVELVDIEGAECGTNPGGGVAVYVAYRQDVNTFPAFETGANANILLSNITMKAGKYFRRWDFDEDTCKVDYNAVGTKGALSVEAVVEFDISKMTPAKALMFDESLNGKMILLIRDANGLVHLIGNPEGRGALRDPATSTTGMAIADKNHDKLIYRCSVGKRTFYTGVIPVEP